MKLLSIICVVSSIFFSQKEKVSIASTPRKFNQAESPYTYIDANIYFLPNYSSSNAAWSISLSAGIGITTTFGAVQLRGYVNSNNCGEPYGYTSAMPTITFKKVSTGSVVGVNQMPTNVVNWKLMPGWILINEVEFSDGSYVLLDNNVVLIIHIMNQSCS